jgi:hypothetical protein
MLAETNQSDFSQSENKNDSNKSDFSQSEDLNTNQKQSDFLQSKKSENINQDLQSEKSEDINQGLIEKLNKQVLDLKKIISKNQKAPEDPEVYKTYKSDSKYKNFHESDIGKNIFNETIELAKTTNLTIDQHKAVVDYINNVLENQGVIDTRTPLEKQKQTEDYVKVEMSKLGENAELTIEKNVKFVKDYIFFNEEQKRKLLSFMNESALNISIVDRFRDLLLKDKSNNIPSSVIGDKSGLEDDYTLWEKYCKSTNNRDKQKIIDDRIKAGRPLEWKHN